ncbi:nuclease HARBI1 [Canna indica]|uniref:Nuclease HARBI1 n=1 Tax=Canna indica TaxID=4628 RepID=A0AAQ3QD56_9LILI|nr:nuclease HARBI1 [Canna indica]
MISGRVAAMGPVRGFKRRKRAEKTEAAAAATAGGQGSGDWWVDFSRRITGHSSSREEEITFESVFKLSRKTFNYICSLVRDNLTAKASNLAFADGQILSVEDQVAIALRRLSSGESLLNIGVSFGVNQSTVSQVTWRFVEAMEERGIQHLSWPNSDELEAIKHKFEKLLGLPNCCGIIDTARIMMCLPSVDTSNKVWVDHEKKHSMILQAIVDPEMRLRDIVTGWPGSMNELPVLCSSGFFNMCEKGTRLNGEKVELAEGLEVREYIIGNSGFPLLPWLLTPYQEKDLLDGETEFNKRLSATRVVAQKALARLKDTWKIIQGEMWRPDKHRLPRIILVCCLLHNIVIELEDEVVRDEMGSLHEHDMSYKQQFCDIVDNNGIILRDKLSKYLSGTLLPSNES